MTPTPEQQAIVDAARTTNKSIMIKAYAGCTKTSTIEMVGRALPVRPSLYVVFNVKNKKEAEKRMPTHFNVKTFNGLGNEAWGRATGKRCAVEEDKLAKVFREVLADHPEFREMNRDQYASVLSLVRKARSSGLVPKQALGYKEQGLIPDEYDDWAAIGDLIYLEVSEGLVWLAREILIRSIKKSYEGLIDYDDQIYMSALFGGVFSKYPEVMVDEGQDLSPLNHIQVARCALDRLIVVGDPLQAIYAFRGAHSHSMEQMRKLKPEWIDLPLTMTFRCPRVVVERQQAHAPGFSAAETNEEGKLYELSEWSIDKVEELVGDKPITILCRNNAPLLSAALRIIRSGRGCTVMGREIGKSLITLSKKIIPSDSARIVDCAEKINAWADKESALAMANGKEAHLAVIEDKKECLLAICESPLCSDAGALRDLLGKMFDTDNLKITLATGHKAKGLEWSTVIHLDPWRIPSKFAMSKKDIDPSVYEQEMNLKYVIETRTKHTLILANLENMG